MAKKTFYCAIVSLCSAFNNISKKLNSEKPEGTLIGMTFRKIPLCSASYLYLS
jgi:hypothetical protein